MAKHDQAAQVLPTPQGRPGSAAQPERVPLRGSAIWPELGSLGLSAAAIAERVGSIGGSDANTILSGSAERILRLWREKRGEVAPEDLSDKLAVMLGSWTEAFNRQWYEKLVGHAVTRVGERVRCPVRPWRSATLDGYVMEQGAIWEAKHTSPFGSPDEVLQRYMPQLQHTMAVVGCETALLSVLYGNSKWEVYEVASDWMYQEDLLEAEMRFWHCVRSGEPPVISIISYAPKPVGVREVCMTGHNAWATFAADWLAHREAAKTHATATSSLKELVEADVARAYGHGIEAKRSKAGAITIREAAPIRGQRS
ncbi:YqaJ viral recombinase family protein [Novosphingobium sp. Gsoil 351]|uniref:YqaJ viral recombinase family protein n=1 Tax=Novosphingobium sp. Gsoil 351 TaxID=2675225 RepID=UPI0018A80E95|nr:YqaJ viral recombinase family protein [Novosphingobium sp. Gsoil 351]